MDHLQGQNRNRRAIRPARRGTRERATRDAILSIVIALAVFVVSAAIDAFEMFVEYSHQHENYELDEVFVFLLALGLGAGVFAWRRLLDLRYEIRRRIRAERSFMKLAMRDDLTGLPNRRLFEDRLSNALTRAKRDGDMIAVTMIDLDRFKRVNDLHGHGAGDTLLQVVAKRIASQMRDSDTLARISGDEFVVLQVGMTQPVGAVRLASRMMSAMAEPIVLDNNQVTVGLSIGIAVFPTDTTTADDLMRFADIALYRAKGERSCFRFYESDMDQQLQLRTAMEKDLIVGLARSEVVPFFQPIVDLEQNKIVCMEALARWHHPERGLISPAEFIPVAEECGQISALFEAILRHSCQAAKSWPDDVTISINLSPVQFNDPGLAAKILDIIREEDLEPHRIELEVTENAIVSDPDAASKILGDLRNAGIRVALDDFGTGYASLSHLRDLPFDKIKIDRSFVGRMEDDASDASIVKAVIGLGSTLGLSVTAEGIESEEQMSALREQGCNLGQGFHVGRPIDSQDVTALFSDHPTGTESLNPRKTGT